MSQNTNDANDEQKIEKITIDSTEKFEAYDRFLNCTHKLVAELANKIERGTLISRVTAG